MCDVNSGEFSLMYYYIESVELYFYHRPTVDVLFHWIRKFSVSLEKIREPIFRGSVNYCARLTYIYRNLNVEHLKYDV